MKYWLALFVYFNTKFLVASASCRISRHYHPEQLTVECDATLPSSEEVEKSKIFSLHLNLCGRASLPKDTFMNYSTLYFLRIECRNGNAQLDDSMLTLEEGIFLPVKNSLNKMTIAYNNIQCLPKGLFCELTTLTKLDLEHNAINDITNLGFGDDCKTGEGLANLTYLRLNNNQIKILHKNTFIRLHKLYYLGISTTGLEEIESGAFTGLVSLKILHLKRNHLAFLPKNIFQSVPNLMELMLDGNILTTSQLPSFDYVPRLEILYLPDNNLTTLTETTFVNNGHLSQLDLSGNRLENINMGFKSLLGLKVLKINKAGVRRIESTAFLTMAHLTELFLKYNELDTFGWENLLVKTNITVLDLSGNNFTTIPMLIKLTTLKSVILSHNKIKDLTPLTSSMPKNLTHLRLSGNRIQRIDWSTFAHLTNLEDLNLDTNKISSIEDGAFDSHTRLRTINLNHNRLSFISMQLFSKTSIESISAAHNNIQRVSYAGIPFQTWKLNFAHNKITDDGLDVIQTYEVDYDTGQFSDGLFITDINLSFNRLETFSSRNFPFTSQIISLHNNYISKIDPSWNLLKLNNLERITLHNNKLKSFCEQYDQVPRAKINITLHGNPLICTCELKWLSYLPFQQRSFTISNQQEVQCIINHPKVKSMKRRMCDLKSEDFLCTSTKDRPSMCECSTRDQHTINDQCIFSCPDKCLCYHDSGISFVIIDCSFRNLTHIPDASTKLGDMHTLEFYLDGNFINAINDSSFNGYLSLNKLFLNNSHLQSIHHKTFRKLRSLHILHLEKNQIQAIQKDLFSDLQYLRELHMSQNQIFFLHETTFFPLVKLGTLRLDRNLLVNFSVWELSKLSYLRNVTLGGNPWSCDCDYIEMFRSWLQQDARIVSDVEKIYCSSGSGDTRTFIPLISFNSSECNATDFPLLISAAPIWASLLGIFVFLTVVAILAFAYRKEMQVLLYSRYGVKLFYKHNFDLDRDKMYDAFVSYSNLDEEFFVYNLLPGLENIPNPYKLCVHQRDFVVGAFITENIMDAVENSCRTIILLSDNFITSEWCRFEFKVAHLKMLTDHCNRVIVIVPDKVPLNVDDEIKLYLKTNTYLKWGDRLFWEKLYFVLPDRHQESEQQ